jgi:hypothetical protein
VIEWAPTARLAVARVATPSASDADPSTVLPSAKVTDPVGVPWLGATADTVAVKVTGAVNTDELEGAVTAVAVWPRPTATVAAPVVGDMEPEYWSLPKY